MSPRNLHCAIFGMMGVALCSTAASARPADPDLRATSLLLAKARSRLALEPASAARHEAQSPFSSNISPMDRFDLASVRTRTARMAIGPVDLMLSANRAANFARRDEVPFDVDRWTLKAVGLTAAMPLNDDLTLSLGGDYGRMTRRLQVVEVNPHRLGTSLMRVGAGLGFADTSRLAIDYVSVSRSSGHDNLTRLAETMGGGPLTGRGPELSFMTAPGSTRGASSWKFSLASMQRPTRDLGLVGNGDNLRDSRAMVAFSLHL